MHILRVILLVRILVLFMQKTVVNLYLNKTMQTEQKWNILKLLHYKLNGVCRMHRVLSGKNMTP